MARTSKKTLFNPNPTPVIYDEEGHMVDGGGRVEVDKLDAAGQEAVDHGVLVLEDDRKEQPDIAGEPAVAKASGESAPKKAP